MKDALNVKGGVQEKKLALSERTRPMNQITQTLFLSN